MSRVCQVTGKKPLVGSNVSHSNRHTKRRFEINLRTKRFWLEDEKRWITLRVSARGMRTIDKLGLSTVVADMRRRGKRTADDVKRQILRDNALRLFGATLDVIAN